MSFGVFKINGQKGGETSMADVAEAVVEQKPAFRDEEVIIIDVAEAAVENK